ncbi:PBP1A family penicillin-binding protein [Alkalihalobacillus sp. LMS6]|uniref:transglycosylase domain-containing protein n=1 Tax=Alkalihalobacillus sp. LMS6 TaxID=2924034 RepID=UPI0020D071D8|nr:PBP1A family penicillin-binding protein [Alkalihalobacillus sp. LMS6]UTR08349.1 PBP1A family penicillin-binding protein [Alkalihalobacillus sp. LMS6]
MADEYKSRQERKHAQTSDKKPKKPKNDGSGGGKKPKKPLFKKILITLLILLGVGLIGGGVAIGVIVASAPDIEREKLMLPQSLQVHDMDDELVFTLTGGENRINADINDMPDHLQNAFLAIEDHRFREHFGVDVRRLGGAVVANLREGFGAEGGSTITQQLVKNLFLSQDKQLTRKIQEAYLAIQLERMYSKDEILEMYLNQINLGPSAGYGVQLASEAYFDKPNLEDLTVADAAVLAAIPQRPRDFDPVRNPENNEQRRNIVIDRMEREDFITAEEAEEARNTDINEQINYTETEDSGWYTFYDEVLKELDDLGFTTDEIYHSGLRVYTTLDTDAQDLVDSVLKSGEYEGLPFPDNEDFRVGVTLLDTESGAVRAMGNGTEENDARVNNYASIQTNHGSVMKPLLGYGPVIENEQWSTGHIIADEPYNYATESDTPVRNFDRQYKGNMRMRQALAESRNVPAVKALNEAGQENAYEFLERMFEPGGDQVESGILGPAQGSTKEIAGAYAAFGNNGAHTEPYTIRKIVYPDGREINVQPETEQVMEDYTGYMVTDMLKSVMTDGTGTTAQVPNVPIAGKTGTSNFSPADYANLNIGENAGAYPTSAFTGYSTEYTLSTWIGFTDRRGDNYLTSEHNQITRNLFRHIMTGMHEGVQTSDFTMPDSVERISVERGTGQLPSAGTPSSEIVSELFVRGSGPSQVSEEFAQDIPDPSGLDYSYNEEAETITFTWSYPADVLDDVEFETSVSSGSLDVSSDSLSATVSNVTPGTYTFSVRARATDGTDGASSSVSVTATIEDEGEEEEEEIEEEEPVEEEPVEEEPAEEEPQQDEDPSGGDDNNGGDTGDDSNDEDSTDTDTSPDEGSSDQGGNGEDDSGSPDNESGNSEDTTPDSGNGNGSDSEPDETDEE